MLRFLQVLQSILQSTPLVGERGKMQKMDDNPTPVPKIKAARAGTGVNQVAEVELCHNDEDMFPEEDTAAIPDSEDEYIAVTTSCNSWMKEQHLMKWRNCFRWMSYSQWCLQKQKHQQRMWLTRHWCTTGDSGMVNGQEDAE